MAYNIPSYNTDNFSFGPGVLYLGAVGSTPTTDVGAVRSGAELTVTREQLVVEQGSPFTKVKTYVVRENVELAVTGIEWNLSHLSIALGAGETTGDASVETMEFGGSMLMSQHAIKFVHVMPVGTTVELYVWKAEGNGEMSVTFGDEIHEFPMTWVAQRSLTDWSGNTLSEKSQLFKIKRWKNT